MQGNNIAKCRLHQQAIRL